MSTAKLQMKVDGMDCSICANAIRRTLCHTEGVHAVQVSLSDQEVLIRYNPMAQTPGGLSSTLRALGFTVDDSAITWRTFSQVAHRGWQRFRWPVILSLLLFTAVLLRPWLGSLVQLAGDADALQQAAANLGWWGPAALIAVNVLQIVVAPLPGYGVYLAAGVLYGARWGGLWATAGLLLGSMAAMAVGRRWGRPAVQRLIGEDTLRKWERLTHSNSALVWGVILLSPIGDAPFLLAGLSNVRFRTILLLTIITRVPAAFAVAALGAGSLHLTWWQLMLIVVALGLPLGLIHKYQETLTERFEALIHRLIPQPTATDQTESKS